METLERVLVSNLCGVYYLFIIIYLYLIFQNFTQEYKQ